MTKNEILEYFKDINHAYNDCTRYDTLKRMLDELQEPCDDAISRQAVAEVLLKYAHSTEGKAFAEFLISQINALPSIKPQYTDTEIQKMQDLEFAEIQKAYEIGKDEGSEVLDKIRTEILAMMPSLGIWMYDEGHIEEQTACEVIADVVQIIDKYKAESEGS